MVPLACRFWRVFNLMHLKVFKTLWGFDGSYTDAINEALRQGYDGIEGPVPETIEETEQFAELLEQTGLLYIAEVATTGTYVPDRKLSVEDHLTYIKDRLERLKTLKPEFITCLGGCDAWDESDSISFLHQAIDIATDIDLDISFETHRGRIFFNPWVTQRIVKKIPSLKLTCDFSHWCVVCEGLQQTEEEIIESLIENAWHVHGRIGYDQGAQIPDPRTPLFKDNIESHFNWWSSIWSEHFKQSKNITTVTPEFGIDRYEYFDSENGKVLVNLDDINLWMADEIRSRFEFEYNEEIKKQQFIK